MIYIGIDPGKAGAIAWMHDTGAAVHVEDTPLTPANDYDWEAMADLLRANLQWRTPAENIDKLVVVIEAVHSMPGDAKPAAFSFGVGYGAWLALVGGVLRVQPTLVDPRRWKTAMLKGIANSPQAEATALRQRMGARLPPGVLEGPRGGLKDGRVDALWLAEYARTCVRA